MPFFFEENDDYAHILIDGQHLVHRSAYAHSELSFVNDEGREIFTGVIYGFLSVVGRVWKRYADRPCSVTVCWEGGYTHRTALYEGYKASRRVPPDPEKQAQMDSMFAQQRVLRRLLGILGWSQARASGFEADDAMATLAARYGSQGSRVALYTGDKDLHQCVTDKVHVISARPKDSDAIWTPDTVRERWGVGPERVAEVLGLAGDGADDIPGCPGCGPGWAKKLLAGPPRSIPQLLQDAEAGILTGEFQGKRWRSPSLSKKLRENAQQVRVSWELAKTVSDAPVEIDKGARDIGLLRHALEQLRMWSLLEGKSWERISQVR